MVGGGPPLPPPPPHHHHHQALLHHHQNNNGGGSRSLKRAPSESDDCDDPFSEESSKDQCSPSGDPDSCQMLSRKKRRGIIEKRRRDRINTSLLELRRLVPTAFEKQGSAKLEKAEILQMTVDHLKSLHAKGTDNMAYDPSKIAMDYHSIGFRECAAEVARYLVTVEGLDLQDPLRLRLMSHLQCFAAQRELAKGTPPPPPWPTAPSPYQTPPHHQHHHHHHLNSSSSSAPSSASTSANSSFESSSSGGGGGGGGGSRNNSGCENNSGGGSSSSPTLTPLTPAIPTSAYHHDYLQHQVPHQPPSYHQDYANPSQKPYRPWGGTELAY